MRRPGRSVQVLFQDSRLLPWMTVRENVRFALQDSNGLGDIAVDQWLRKVGLHDLSGAWPRTLSGGEESRVAFARTFVDPPQVLLLDEPFRNLDIVTKLGLIGELGSHLAEFAITAVLVSHDVMDAVLLSDRVVVLEARPLRVQRIFDIGLPWPRDFRSAAVLSTVGEIVENLHPTAMPEDLDDSHRDGGKPPT
jgi:ABC-type nitrate/sulfonate/bicarbonate transport system ATPase subunit